MALKLKLKVGSRTPSEPEQKEKPLPKIRIKPLVKPEPSDGISKPRPKREKLKKLKLSLGRAASPQTSESNASAAPTQPILKRVPKVRIKPTRIPGEGYDSEAPDVEDDPLIEQGIVVRFANDVNLDFIHNASDTGDFSNVNIKWITRDKAVVNVNLTLYSARLIDLPTLTELYKTVDKKNIFKTIDISQILLVLHQINPKQLNMDTDFEVPEEYTYVHPLYKLSVNKEIRNTKTVFNHGLAYAYEDVYRRFRPRKTNPRVMADIELRVDELVRLDQEAQESHYEYVDGKSLNNKFGSHSRSHTPSASMPTTPSLRTDDSERINRGDEDEEEEEENEQQMALDLEADIDNVLEQELAEALDLTSNTTAATVLMKSEFDNEDGEDDDDLFGQADDDDEGDDDDDDDDEEEEEEEEDDDDEATKQDKSRVKKLEEEISDLERAADKQKVLLATASFKMMRMKFQSAYNNLKGQLDQKKRELAKIREQQQKQKMVPAAITKNDDDEEEDDEEDDDDEEENDEENDQNQHNDNEQSAQPEQLGDAAEIAGEEDNDNDDDNDIDDFQGLF